MTDQDPSMYRKQPIDNPGPVITTDLDDRLDCTNDPVAIAITQIRFDDDLKQEHIAQHVQHQIDIRRCLNPSCPTDECNCRTSEQFRPQFEPQPGDLGFNPQGPVRATLPTTLPVS